MKNLCEFENLNLDSFGISVPEILLPKNIDTKTWSVIACDQYTQDRAYWKKAEEIASQNPSTLNLILPEIYLNAEDKPKRIEKIKKTMKEYLSPSANIFDEPKKCMIYLERKTNFGRTRKGLVAQIDLETYEWKPFSKANIRATEATIMERIPPRKEIRKGASLELPHIMLLVDDKENLLIEKSGSLVKNKKPLYSGELMCNGGYITGWAIESESEIENVTKAVKKIALEKKDAEGNCFLFAVGDGNHSLATAKAVWEEEKNSLIEKGASQEELLRNPVRYTLVEIVNIYDKGLTFEPIHRVIFNVDAKDLIKFLAEKLQGTVQEVADKSLLLTNVHKSNADFGFSYCEDGKQKYILLKTKISELAVARLQLEIDEFLKSKKVAETKPEIDYIHGSEEVLKLGEKENAVGILLPPIAKDSFFETIKNRGSLPRKSFSMGEADEKRFYLECRKLFSE